MTKRKAIGKKARFEIFKRDGFTCQYCGAAPPSVVLEVDHILAVANGGDSSPDNLVTSCFNCNRGKAATILTAVPDSLAGKAKKTRESELQLKGFYEILQAKKDRLEEESWVVAEIMQPGCSEDGFNIKNRAGITRFLEKIDYFQVIEAMEIAVAKFPQGNYRTYRYFCGVCWNRIGGSNG
ncbi:MAG: HNH endonuclease [Desulfuromonadales bacterium]|nr:HNH endonuclease [Desulfuromonadales bacterium]